MTSLSRITQQTVARHSLAGLQSNLRALQDIQDQIGAGKRVRRPSDDPSSVAIALRARAQLDRNAQYESSLDTAASWLGTADTALMTANTQLQQAREIVLQGMNAATSQANREALASQIEELRASLLNVANTTYLDRPIFAGTAGGSGAYDATGQFVGDGSAVQASVAPNTVLDVNIAGPVAFGNGASNVFATLTQIADDLRTTPGNLTADLGALDGHLASVRDALGVVGARAQRVELLKSATATTELGLKAELSSAEDVDMAAAALELGIRQVAYQAALAATSRVIQPSLVDFLR